nr:MAG TPA: hypothetical protein [Caudoviricetes sp.]
MGVYRASTPPKINSTANLKKLSDRKIHKGMSIAWSGRE